MPTSAVYQTYLIHNKLSCILPAAQVSFLEGELLKKSGAATREQRDWAEARRRLEATVEELNAQLKVSALATACYLLLPLIGSAGRVCSFPLHSGFPFG